MKKIIILLVIVICGSLVYFGESRNFLYSENGECVTFWKTYNNTCYIVFGKYYGIVKPSSMDYIQTTNDADVDILWMPHSDSIIVSFNKGDLFLNTKSTHIINYKRNSGYFDSIFIYFDGHYKRYKKEIDRISIHTKEGYAINGMDKRL